MAHFDECNSPTTNAVQVLKELDDRFPQQEILSLQLRASTIFSANPNILSNPRWWIENRLTTPDLKIFKTAKVVLLHQLEQLPAPCRQRSLRGKVVHGVVFLLTLVSKEAAPDRRRGGLDTGANRSVRFFSHRRGNVFTKEALQAA
jgi:hypothetical protein